MHRPRSNTTWRRPPRPRRPHLQFIVTGPNSRTPSYVDKGRRHGPPRREGQTAESGRRGGQEEGHPAGDPPEGGSTPRADQRPTPSTPHPGRPPGAHQGPPPERSRKAGPPQHVQPRLPTFTVHLARTVGQHLTPYSCSPCSTSRSRGALVLMSCSLRNDRRRHRHS